MRCSPTALLSLSIQIQMVVYSRTVIRFGFLSEIAIMGVKGWGIEPRGYVSCGRSTLTAESVAGSCTASDSLIPTFTYIQKSYVIPHITQLSKT